MTNHCTHAQAIALKEIGFDMEVRDWYDWRNIREKGIAYLNHNQWKDSTSAPTRSEVLQWAREKHGIDAWVQPFTYNVKKVYFYNFIDDNEKESSLEEYPTHPEAESALVWKIIELIKQKKA